MTKATRNLAAMAAATAVLAFAARAAAEPRAVVVLHLTNDSQVPNLELRFARETTQQIYGQAGVDVQWTLEERGLDQRGLHFEVLLLSLARTEQKCRVDGVGETICGSVARPTRRAFVFYPRAEDYASRTGSNIPRLLGGIMAHEVGHLLPPVNGHSPNGLMRAEWNAPLAYSRGSAPGRQEPSRSASDWPTRSLTETELSGTIPHPMANQAPTGEEPSTT